MHSNAIDAIQGIANLLAGGTDDLDFLLEDFQELRANAPTISGMVTDCTDHTEERTRADGSTWTVWLVDTFTVDGKVYPVKPGSSLSENDPIFQEGLREAEFYIDREGRLYLLKINEED